MKNKQAVVVLIGQETASRPWVQHEIEKAHADKRPMLGVHIHRLSSFGETDLQGSNPFTTVGINGVPIYTPSGTNSADVRNHVTNNLPLWIETTIRAHKR